MHQNESASIKVPSLNEGPYEGPWLADGHRTLLHLVGLWIFFLGQFFRKGATGRVA